MPGYTLVEQKMLAPFKPNGIAPYANAIGILDFLRELAADEFPFPRLSEWRVLGLEQVLYALPPDERHTRALEIRKRLDQAASALERRLLSVQIVFEGELHHGNTLWSEYRGHRLELSNIFGKVRPHTDNHGNKVYLCNFHLSS